MSFISSSELIINDRGAIYHLNCRPEEIADSIITVGDPDRVQEISKYFDKIEFNNKHREFITHTGYIGNKRLTVMSTGIGPDNIDIVVNELDALVNIDLGRRVIKGKLQTLNIIRVGTAGSLQSHIPINSFVASTHGLGLDNMINFYLQCGNDEDKQLIQAFNTHTQLHNGICTPYINGASGALLKEFVKNFHQGITVSCPGFYGAQGRVIRMGLAQPDLINRLTSFNFGQHQITNFEMETAAIYGLGKILGHHCISLNAIVANRVTKEFTKDLNGLMENLIKTTLEIISNSKI